MHIPDNYEVWEANEIKKEKLLEQMPVCSICEEHIQEETAIYIDARWICENCINDHRKEVLPE